MKGMSQEMSPTNFAYSATSKRKASPPPPPPPQSLDRQSSRRHETERGMAPRTATTTGVKIDPAFDERLQFQRILGSQLREMLQSHGPSDEDTKQLFDRCQKEIISLQSHASATRSSGQSEANKKITEVLKELQEAVEAAVQVSAAVSDITSPTHLLHNSGSNSTTRGMTQNEVNNISHSGEWNNSTGHRQSRKSHRRSKRKDERKSNSNKSPKKQLRGHSDDIERSSEVSSRHHTECKKSHRTKSRRKHRMSSSPPPMPDLFADSIKAHPRHRNERSQIEEHCSPSHYASKERNVPPQLLLQEAAFKSAGGSRSHYSLVVNVKQATLLPRGPSGEYQVEVSIEESGTALWSSQQPLTQESIPSPSHSIREVDRSSQDMTSVKYYCPPARTPMHTCTPSGDCHWFWDCEFKLPLDWHPESLHKKLTRHKLTFTIIDPIAVVPTGVAQVPLQTVSIDEPLITALPIKFLAPDHITTTLVDATGQGSRLVVSVALVKLQLPFQNDFPPLIRQSDDVPDVDSPHFKHSAKQPKLFQTTSTAEKIEQSIIHNAKLEIANMSEQLQLLQKVNADLQQENFTMHCRLNEMANFNSQLSLNLQKVNEQCQEDAKLKEELANANKLHTEARVAVEDARREQSATDAKYVNAKKDVKNLKERLSETEELLSNTRSRFTIEQSKLRQLLSDLKESESNVEHKQKQLHNLSVERRILEGRIEAFEHILYPNGRQMSYVEPQERTAPALLSPRQFQQRAQVLSDDEPNRQPFVWRSKVPRAHLKVESSDEIAKSDPSAAEHLASKIGEITRYPSLNPLGRKKQDFSSEHEGQCVEFALPTFSSRSHHTDAPDKCISSPLHTLPFPASHMNWSDISLVSSKAYTTWPTTITSMPNDLSHLGYPQANIRQLLKQYSDCLINSGGLLYQDTALAVSFVSSLSEEKHKFAQRTDGKSFNDKLVVNFQLQIQSLLPPASIERISASLLRSVIQGATLDLEQRPRGSCTSGKGLVYFGRFEVNGPFDDVACIVLSYILADGSETTVCLKMPLPCAVFFTPLILNKHDFQSLWCREDFSSTLCSDILLRVRAEFGKFGGAELLRKALSLGESFAVMSGIDQSFKHVVAAGIYLKSCFINGKFSTKQDERSKCLNKKKSLPCLIRVEQGEGPEYTGIYRISVRCPSPHVANSVQKTLMETLGCLQEDYADELRSVEELMRSEAEVLTATSPADIGSAGDPFMKHVQQQSATSVNCQIISRVNGSALSSSYKTRTGVDTNECFSIMGEFNDGT